MMLPDRSSQLQAINWKQLYASPCNVRVPLHSSDVRDKVISIFAMEKIIANKLFMRVILGYKCHSSTFDYARKANDSPCASNLLNLFTEKTCTTISATATSSQPAALSCSG